MPSPRGLCLRCGSTKGRALGSCPACGDRPEGDDRLLAWLVSRHHLSEPEFEEAARRLAAGEELRPPPEMLEQAGRALYRVGAEASVRGDEARDPLFVDEPLDGEQQVLLGLANVLFSPAVGLVAWYSFRERRPIAARQALRITVPTALVLGAVWALVYAVRA